MTWIENIPSAWKGHRKFAEWLIACVKPDIVVDLGVDYGYSTFVWQNALAVEKKGVVFGYDTFEGDKQTGVRNTYRSVFDKIFALALTNIEIVRSDFATGARHWIKNVQRAPVDILHIDGLHTLDAVTSDFTEWFPLVKDDGVVLFHDINVINPEFGVREFFITLNHSGYHRLYFLHWGGLGIYTKNTELVSAIKVAFEGQVYDHADVPLELGHY